MRRACDKNSVTENSRHFYCATRSAPIRFKFEQSVVGTSRPRGYSYGSNGYELVANLARRDKTAERWGSTIDPVIHFRPNGLRSLRHYERLPDVRGKASQKSFANRRSLPHWRFFNSYVERWKKETGETGVLQDENRGTRRAFKTGGRKFLEIIAHRLGTQVEAEISRCWQLRSVAKSTARCCLTRPWRRKYHVAYSASQIRGTPWRCSRKRWI